MIEQICKSIVVRFVYNIFIDDDIYAYGSNQLQHSVSTPNHLDLSMHNFNPNYSQGMIILMKYTVIKFDTFTI